MRAAAVFLTSVVMFAAMIVIAHSLKATGGTTQFRPATGRDLVISEPSETASTWQWPETRVDLGPLRHVGTVPEATEEPTPVVTAKPVPDDTTVAANSTAGSGGSSGSSRSATGSSRTSTSPSRSTGSAGSTSGTSSGSGSRGTTQTSPSRWKQKPKPGSPAQEPAAAPEPAPQPTPSESASESAGTAEDPAATAASETPSGS
jgi:hypothetical protein